MSHLHAHEVAHLCHRGGEFLRLFPCLHEGAAAELHVQDETVQLLRELLAHDARHDQGLGRDRARHVAQRVEFFVRRANVRTLADHENADALELGERAAFIDMNIEAGDAFEFVEGASGNAEAAPGNHRDPIFIAGQQRRQHQRSLVSDAARGMLVHFRRRAGRILQDVAAFHHRGGEMLRFRGRHSSKEDRHRPGAHLVIGNLAGGKSRDEIANFVGGQLLTFAFFFDEAGDVHLEFISYFDALGAGIS